MIIYTMGNKSKAPHNDNYIEDFKRDCSKDKTDCYNCIFVGENELVSQERLCAKHMEAIAEVDAFATCDKGESRFKWYNRVNPIKKYLLERSGFKFKNR